MRLGWMELVLILGVVLLFFGPKRLPGLGNSLGSAIRNFKRGLSGSVEENEGRQLPEGQASAPASPNHTFEPKA